MSGMTSFVLCHSSYIIVMRCVLLCNKLSYMKILWTLCEGLDISIVVGVVVMKLVSFHVLLL